ncbi:amino acid permease [Alkalinema sp. FACHB-956]|uniref:amino acid permease n=1 Tax=Alkalinema sp. FACHB-956 TaxID=2692768 RepID=UPI001684E442|nr:amino acid permease [Alkalinema sp. FACHB-956]MBD2326035.1 amino acid permease [Alkalinema sp. FACHB-956]
MTRPAFSILPLPRSLPSLETWGFGFSGLLLWLGTAPVMHAELGPNALWVWIPGTIVGVFLNLQVQQLGRYLPDIAGGTPNYTAHLLQRFPKLARYGAIGYFLGWISVPPMNAIILTDLIKANLDPLGITCPELWLRIGFTALPFLVAFRGTRTIGILHAFFVFPAIGLLLAFCLQGLGWLAVSPTSPGLLPTVETSITLIDWMKWFFIAVYAVYGCETASSFVADSRRPKRTLQCLAVTACLIPIVYIGGSWVLMQLNPAWGGVGDSTYLHLIAAAQSFWGSWAATLVTFLITSGCLLSSATAVSNCPRTLYQLAKDGYLPPVFAFLSRQEVLEPSLIFTFCLSLLCLIWGDVARVVMVTGTGYLASMMAIHLGLWLNRKQPEVRWPQLSLLFFTIEAMVLIVGGLAWGWQDWILGLLLPAFVGMAATQGSRLKWKWLQIEGWIYRDRQRFARTRKDWLSFQVLVLLGLLCGALSIGWGVRSKLAQVPDDQFTPLFSILLVIVAFVGVAIACWTTLPQISAITEARDQVERTLQDLQQTQTQLIQAEKMSSLGQLVAGIAHEINNPVNFIHGNLKHLNEYTDNLLQLIDHYQMHYPHPVDQITDLTEEMDLAFLREDLPNMLGSMRMGTDRIRQIVLSLRNFSRLDESDLKAVNLHEGIDSTLLILQHRLKARSDRAEIQVIKEYGELPLVECYPGLLNQVFMNILANAIDALEECSQKKKSALSPQESGRITIRTARVNHDWVEIAIVDNGPGIPESVQKRIFEPFFTTKPVGKGTGMGMSISYQIITEKHQGKLNCYSSEQQGTEFSIQIPLQQAAVSQPSTSSTPGISTASNTKSTCDCNP